MKTSDKTTSLTVDLKVDNKHQYLELINESLEYVSSVFDGITDLDKKRAIQKQLKQIATSPVLASVMRCSGSECTTSSRCPFYLEKVSPVGKDCPLELSLINKWRWDYVNEYDVDPNSPTDLGLVNELAEIDLLERRVSEQLSCDAENSSLVKESFTGESVVSPGTYFSELKEHPLYLIKERLKTRRGRILKLLVGDRQEKYKRDAALKLVSGEDAASEMASLRKQLDKLTEMIENKGKKKAEKPVKDREVKAVIVDVSDLD